MTAAVDDVVAPAGDDRQEYVRRAVAEAPPLSEGQRANLATIFVGSPGGARAA